MCRFIFSIYWFPLCFHYWLILFVYLIKRWLWYKEGQYIYIWEKMFNRIYSIYFSYVRTFPVNYRLFFKISGLLPKLQKFSVYCGYFHFDKKKVGKVLPLRTKTFPIYISIRKYLLDHMQST